MDTAVCEEGPIFGQIQCADTDSSVHWRSFHSRIRQQYGPIVISCLAHRDLPPSAPSQGHCSVQLLVEFGSYL
jgi:hypothetical protein